MTLALGAPPRSGAWQEDPGFGVYVHIPFCRHRCRYCDFNAYEGQQELHLRYVDALIGDIERGGGATRRATSIFFGGGTPTLLSASSLTRVLQAIRRTIGIEDDAEITVEANPETVDEAKFDALLSAGFNRFSIGVQSLASHVLRGLGRAHPPEVALQALRAARRAGVTDLNVDLIYGSPWERDDDWVSCLRDILRCSPEHISAYALTVEESTPLATLVSTGRLPDVDPDVQATRHDVASELLGAAGYERYEISNWARPSRASRHNVLYWSAGDYLGFGAGAHGHVDGRRWWTLRLPRDFIAAVEQGASTTAGAEHLSPDERLGETLMLGLRLASGVDLGGLGRRVGDEALSEKLAVISELVERGLLLRRAERLTLAPQATLVANDVLCCLL